jgi:hypothetical protein
MTQTSPPSHPSPTTSTSSIIDISSSTFSLDNSNIDNLSLLSTDDQFIVPTLPTETFPTSTQSFHLPRMSHHTGLAQMPHKYHREAPDTFRGRASVAKEFIEEVEIILTQYKVTSDLDKIKGLLRYCSRSVAKFIRTLTSYHTPNWEKLKAEFLHYYDADQEDDDNRPSDLVRFAEENKREPMETLGAWLRYYRDYMTMATPLVKNETLSDRHCKTLFWMGIPDDLQRIFEFRLQATSNTYNPRDPYTIEDITKVAEQHFERNKFTEMFFNAPRREPQYDSSDSDSEYEHRRGRWSHRAKNTKRRKSRAKDRNYSPEPTPIPTVTTQRYNGSADEIEGMIKQLNTMSLQDPNYGHLYFKVLRLDTTGLASQCIYRKPLQVTTAFPSSNNRPSAPRPRPPVVQTAATFPNNIPVQQPQQPRFSQSLYCYGCSSSDHMMGDCPEIKELMEKGVLIRDPTTRKYYMANGTEIIRNRGETLAQSALRQQQSYIPSTNLVSISEDIASYYQGEAYDSQEEEDQYFRENPYYQSSATDSESDSEPEWKQVLRAQRSYPVECSTKRTTEARREVNKVPSRPAPGKSTFDGVWPPPRNVRPKSAVKENVSPTNHPMNPPASEPKVIEEPTQVLQPIDARKPRFITDDMVDPKPKKLPPRDPSPHISAHKENMERTRGPARQSELSSQVDAKTIANDILNSEITMPLRNILGTSKEIANTFQDLMRAKNKTTLPPTGNTPMVATGMRPRPLKPKGGYLIKLRVLHEGNPMIAIVDTGSEVNIIKEDIALDLQLPIDMTQPIQMNDANGGLGNLDGYIPEVTLACGALETIADLYVAGGEKIPFDLLFGRPWQVDNCVSIIERKQGTFLEFRDEETDIVTHRIFVTPRMKMPYPKNYKRLRPIVEFTRRQRANMGAYSFVTMQVPSTEEINNIDSVNTLQSISPTPSFNNFMLSDTSEENSQSQISITDDFFEYEDQSFNFPTVNTFLQPPGIIIQPSEPNELRCRLRKILELPEEEESDHKEIFAPPLEEKSGHNLENEGPTLISNAISLMGSEDNSFEDKEHDTTFHGDTIHLTMEGIFQYDSHSNSDLALIDAETALATINHPELNSSYLPSGHFAKNTGIFRYLSLKKLFKTPNSFYQPAITSTMNNASQIHPHAPIMPADVNQQHPITGQQLISASMSLNSNSAVIAELRQDQNITDEHFADCIFPDATLTVFQNGALQVVHGRASCCFHFNSDDPRMYHAAALTMPGAVMLRLQITKVVITSRSLVLVFKSERSPQSRVRLSESSNCIANEN